MRHRKRREKRGLNSVAIPMIVPPETEASTVVFEAVDQDVEPELPIFSATVRELRAEEWVAAGALGKVERPKKDVHKKVFYERRHIMENSSVSDA